MLLQGSSKVIIVQALFERTQMRCPQLGTSGGKFCPRQNHFSSLDGQKVTGCGRLPHVARHRRRRRAPAFIKHFAGHAQALALGDPAALAYGDARSILSALFASVSIPPRQWAM